MPMRRFKQRGAISGLRSIQTLGSLAVPGTLEQVPEGDEVKSAKPDIFASNDWKSIQNAVQEIFRVGFNFNDSGKLYRLHENVKNVLESKTGTFLCDCYKEWISKELGFMADTLRDLKGSNLLLRLEEIWTTFFTKILPILEAVLYRAKPKGRLSVRTITLTAFRDFVLLSKDIEGALIRYKRDLSPKIMQMILILQTVNDSYPPNKNKLQLEYIASQIYSPFLGYYGLYDKGALIVASNEPMLAAKRRPSADIGGPRRISRPFSVQPQHMDTLNQLFQNAVRHKSAKDRKHRKTHRKFY